MESSVYISSEQIQVVGYSGGVIREFVTHPLPEGTMINGMITDQAFLIECLASMRGEHPELFKKPSLVVDGSAILVKRIPTPKLGKKQYRQLVRDDFSEAGENADDLACGFQTLPGGRALLACAADKSVIDNYTSAFKSVGVNLRSIRVGTQAIMSYIATRPELQQKSFVLNMIDGVTMLSLIFENGVNVFISRTRLYGDTKEQLAQTIIDNLGGLIQFNRSQKFGEVTDSYYLGVSAADLKLLEALSPHVNVKLAVLDIFQGVRGGERLPPNAHFAYLCTRLGKNDIDLAVSRKELVAHRKKKKAMTKRWIPFAILYIILLGLPVGYFYYQANEVGKDTGAVNAYLQDPANIAKQAELGEIESETLRLRGVSNQYDNRITYEGGLADISVEVIELILNGYGPAIRIESFIYERKTGTVRILGFAETEDDTSYYSEMLKGNSLIETVNHIGYYEDYTFEWDVVLAVSGEETNE